MGKTLRFSHRPKEKRYTSRYNEGGTVPKSSLSIDISSKTTSKNKIVATGDKYNSYKTRIS